MLRVIIADDEEKVCRLIYKLVDWDSLGMEVTAIAYNGIEALENIKTHNPDIVITDIRMPGYDGLELIQKSKDLNEFIEFIIISGYRHFDYAQSAIKYGVNDYLLKPIKKEELLQTLGKMKEKYDKRNEKNSKDEEMKLLLKQNRQKIRSSIFVDYLTRQNNTELILSVEEINKEYQFHFHEGCFQVILIKIDHNGELNHASIKFLENKTVNLVFSRLKDYCFDIECCFISGAEYCLMNYQEENRKSIRKQLKMLLDELILQEVLFEKVKFTIGTGVVVNEIKDLFRSAHSAEFAVEQRLIAGTGKIIEDIERKNESITENMIFFEFHKSLSASFDSMDAELAKSSVRCLKDSLFSILDNQNSVFPENTSTGKSTFTKNSKMELSGHDILEAVREACNIFLSRMRMNQISAKNAAAIIEEFLQHSTDYSSADELFSYLEETVAEGLGKIAEDKKQKDKRPIRTAKLYIQSHYMNSITLEEVSSAAGFNPTYFSSVFKKETGSTFLEYLSEIRMEAAKESLKNTNLNIAVICEQVGYSDVRHFTKNFTKHTGLKPNEYRKLYS